MPPWNYRDRPGKAVVNVSLGKEPVKKVSCPFCGLAVDRPRELKTRRPGEMPAGACACGAVYIFDITGHNLGTAFLEALVLACDMDWELASDLASGEDYTDKILERYDAESHYIVPGGAYEGRRIAGALYFVRLHRDIREVTGEGAARKLLLSEPEPFVRAAAKVPAIRKSLLTKKQVEELIGENRIGPLLEAAAAQDKKVLRHLQRLLCSGDRLFRFRVTETLGRVCAVIAAEDPAPVANLLHELANSFQYSAASNWGALEAIGEIIAGAPRVFGGYIPVLYQFLQDEGLRPQAVRSIGTVARVRPDLIRWTIPRLLPFLQDPNPETCGCTAWVLGHLAAPEARPGLAAITGRDETVWFHEDGAIVPKTVGRLAAEALEKIEAGSPGLDG